MDWFLYEGDIRHERVNAALHDFRLLIKFLEKIKTFSSLPSYHCTKELQNTLMLKVVMSINGRLYYF